MLAKESCKTAQNKFEDKDKSTLTYKLAQVATSMLFYPLYSAGLLVVASINTEAED